MNKTLFFKTVFAVVLLGSMTVAVAQPSVPIKKNMPLKTAKAKLAKAGWISIGAAQDKAAIGNIQKKYIAQGFNEVRNCGVGNPECEFVYRKGERCVIVAAGSYEALVAQTRVRAWTVQACRD